MTAVKHATFPHFPLIALLFFTQYNKQTYVLLVRMRWVRRRRNELFAGGTFWGERESEEASVKSEGATKTAAAAAAAAGLSN